MATVVRDPRDIVTPDAFRVADFLIGTPLARPWRRLWAVLIDLLLVAILVWLLNALVLLIAFAAAFLVFRLSRGPSDRWYQRFFRRGLGCFGAVLVFSVILVFATLVSGDDDDEAGPTITGGDSAAVSIEGLGVVAGALLVNDGVALRRATRDGERDTIAARLVDRLVDEGMPPRQIRDAFADIAGDSVLPAPAMLALEAAIETTSARLENRPPRSIEEVRAADSLLAVHAADSAAAARATDLAVARMADSAALAADTLPTAVDSNLVAARDSIRMLRAELGQRTARLEEEQRLRRADAERADNSAFRWVISSVADELGLGLGWLGLYFTAFTVLGGGQTPGKRLFRLRVIRLDGRPIGWWTSLQRFGGYSASVLTGLVGFAEMFWDDNRQALQDKLVHTVVIQEPKPGATQAAEADAVATVPETSAEPTPAALPSPAVDDIPESPAPGSSDPHPPPPPRGSDGMG